MEDLSEKEQIDQMRAWWSEYGNYVVGGIVIGIVIMVGINRFGSQTEAMQAEASVLYETVSEAVAEGDVDEAETAVDDLLTNYSSTVYPSQARLAIARLYMDRGRDQDAADALRAVVDYEGKSEIGLVAKLRLAKVLLYQNKPQEVVDLLTDRAVNAYSARFNEALGDAHVMLGNHADAQAAYQAALADSAAAQTVDRTLLQMKIHDLPELAPEPSAEDPEAADAAPEDTAEDTGQVQDADAGASDDVGDEETG